MPWWAQRLQALGCALRPLNAVGQPTCGAEACTETEGGHPASGRAQRTATSSKCLVETLD